MIQGRLYFAVVLSLLLCTSQTFAGRWQEDRFERAVSEVQKNFKKVMEDSKYSGVFSHKVGSVADGSEEAVAHLRKMREVLDSPSTPKDVRTFKIILDELRAALATPAYAEGKNKALTELLESLSYNFITQTDMRPFAYSFPLGLAAASNSHQQDDSSKHKEERSYENLQELLSQLKQSVLDVSDLGQKIKTSPQLNSSLLKQASLGLTGGTLDGNFDPSTQENHPYKRMILKRKGDHQVTCLHMATPTLRSDASVEVNPEFIAYLKHQKRLGGHHTYINFQKDTPVTFLDTVKRFGVETYRAQCLERMSTIEELKSVIDVITLDKNSDFYWQKKSRNATSSADEFIEEFIDRVVTDGRSVGFHFPTIEKKAQAKKLILDLKEALGWNQSNKKVSLQEKRDFIEISYLFMMSSFSAGSDVVNFSCKDDIDRGAGAKSLLLFATILKEVVGSPDKFLKDPALFDKKLSVLSSLVFADALMAKDRLILEERLERFQEGAQALLKYLDIPEFYVFFKHNFDFEEVEL